MLGVARYLLKLADDPRGIDLSNLVSADTSLSQEEQLRFRSARILLEIRNNTTQHGSAGALRKLAIEHLNELQTFGIEAESAMGKGAPQSFDRAKSEIDGLVVSLLVGETLDKKQIYRLRNTLTPIVNFLSRPTGDPAAYAKNGCAENVTVAFPALLVADTEKD